MLSVRAHSHLATATQIFDVVSKSSEMGCIVTNVTVRTWRQRKTHRCRQVRMDPNLDLNRTCECSMVVSTQDYVGSIWIFFNTANWKSMDVWPRRFPSLVLKILAFYIYSVCETLADVKTLVFLLTVPCLSGLCLISWIRLIEQEPVDHDYWVICSLRQPHNSVG